ncbi:hypothetical protein BDM02DRAFT_3118449 [Thelephora ganbajun]|uniref:Uncharacterized protein n=1 Tax=Thelephora ganbajun TaxID=370292 RepID=A0ACB6Z9V8_THEGA|nr:hypothetical protein BDM02DRAFT_3118449 [Thelephora ganbajun]
MAHFNNYDANFYPTPAPGEFDEYSFLGQTLATGYQAESYHSQGHYTFADHSNVVEQSEPTVGSSTSYWATANRKCHCNLFVCLCLTRKFPESVASATSYATHVDGYGQPSYSEYQWPAVGHQAEFYHTGFLNRDTSFAETVASEASTVVPTDREQFRSTTGGITRTGNQTARSTK